MRIVTKKEVQELIDNIVGQGFRVPHLFKHFIDDYVENPDEDNEDGFDIEYQSLNLTRKGINCLNINNTTTAFCCGTVEFGEFVVNKSLEHDLLVRIINTLLSLASIHSGAAIFTCINEDYSSNRIRAVLEQIRNKRKISYNNKNTGRDLTTYIIPLNNQKAK